MRQRPPRSTRTDTLFPYTTLCRVILLAQYGEDVVGAERPVALPDQLQHTLAQGGQAYALARAEAVGFGQRVADAMVMVVGRTGQRGDRKSTRLNSSH